MTTEPATPTLSNEEANMLRDTAVRYAEKRGIDLALSKRLVWQMYQSKGMSMALGMAATVHDRRPIAASATAKSALEAIRAKLRGGRGARTDTDVLGGDAA